MVAFVNNIKTAALLGGLFALVVVVGSFWGWQGILFAGAIGVAMNFSVWFFSDKIAIASMGAKEVDDRSAPELVEMVRRLADRANLPMPRVYVCPQEAPNAFATGRNPRNAAVAVTVGALRLLDRHELEGVMAHELAHIKNRDTLTSTIAGTVAGIFSMLAQMAFLFGGTNNREGSHPLLGLVVIIGGAIGAALIKAMISRSREYVADADGAAIAGSPDGLASALRKLESFARRVPMEQPNPAMNNLFIVEPAMRLGGNTLFHLFATHPPTDKRIAALLGRR
jgi:heat shock protein HtpX